MVFVRHALPGERVRARVTARSPSYWRADAVEILEPSEDRVVPPCRHAGPGRCGGCDYQHVTLARQRAMKAELVAGQLRHLAGVDRPVVVEEADGAPGGLGWRTRVQFAVGPGDRTGLRRHRSHEIEPIERCLIAAPGIEALGVEGRTWPGVAQVEVATTPAGDRALVSVTTRRGRRPALPRRSRPAWWSTASCAGGRAPSPSRSKDGASGWAPGPSGRSTAAAPTLLAEALLAAATARTGQQVVDLFAGVGLFSSLLPRPSAPADRCWPSSATPGPAPTPGPTPRPAPGQGHDRRRDQPPDRPVPGPARPGHARPAPVGGRAPGHGGPGRAPARPGSSTWPATRPPSPVTSGSCSTPAGASRACGPSTCSP